MSRRYRDEAWREKIAAGHEGNSLPEDFRERISRALTGITRSDETRRKMSESTAGEDNPNWRGGYSNRYGSEWSLVRDRIRERDGVCQHCGHDGTEYRLEVHHIIPVRVFRESAETSVEGAHHPENLVLLCNRCHTKADHGLLGLESGIDPPDADESHDST